ncbi:MAG TPA: universal stress protein [Acetobacteraceae bacterium]|nr:universal stress protein [Acetobacteraceae bacterium]
MTIRKILLPISNTAAGESALATTLVAAKIWGAHVAGLHVHVDARDVAPLAGEGLSGAMIEEMMAATEKESSERATAIRSLFDRALAEHGIKLAEPRNAEPVATASFTVATGREEELVAQQARLADLTVVARPEVEGETASADALHAVLFDSGRPVLLAPSTAPSVIGRRVGLAWNGTAESASAVTAALPWLREADAVCIFSSEGYQRRGPTAQEVVPYLAMHGVVAQIRMFSPVEGVVGAGLLAAAAAFEADLLAMGAYSHSRLRQLILGGVTRHVLEHARLPILMNR